MSHSDPLTPIEVYKQLPQYREELRKRKIVQERPDGAIFIPHIPCEIWNTKDDKGGKRERKLFPLAHQKFLFLLEDSLGDIDFALEEFDKNDSFEFPNGKIISPVYPTR